jgi:hypothetical protein
MATTTDIRPDLTGDVPRCSAECQYYDIERRQRGPDWYDEDGVCRHESAMREPGDVCLPAVRQLVALSRRRCDGCRDRLLVRCAHMRPDDYCSRWEARR